MTFTTSLTPTHSTLGLAQLRHRCGPRVFEISHTTPGWSWDHRRVSVSGGVWTAVCRGDRSQSGQNCSDFKDSCNRQRQARLGRNQWP